jgi:tryptophan synthase alpha chain
MNRINDLFQQKQRNILSIYFTAGFPRLNDTADIIRELQKAGIDMIEVGIPFSDPMADGAVIQKSSTVALRNGMNLKLLFGQLETVRDEVSIPLIMMGYLNPIMQYGFEPFCRDCQKAGVSGMIIPDLPFNDYRNDYKPVADRYGLKMIMLITPETSEERIRLIDEHTDGFIYMVSSAATTGAQKSFDERIQAYFQRINRLGLRNPRLIGFGISNRETLDAAFENASGAIVGSKFISLLGEEKQAEKAVRKLMEELRAHSIVPFGSRECESLGAENVNLSEQRM